MNELALFAGAGGGILGAKLLGWRTVCAVEIDPYCREVLLRRQEEGFLPPFPVWDDVRSFDGKPWRGKVDVVSAGFPCQPFSVAGKKQAAKDPQNLWPETLRIISEVRPPFALLENVPRIVSRGYIGTIFRGLAEGGYDARWDHIPAAVCGAHFFGDRLWIIAQSTEARSLRWQRLRANPSRAFSSDEFTRLVERELQLCVPAGSRGRVSDGISRRVDRLKALGNGQVPAVATSAWNELSRTIGHGE